MKIIEKKQIKITHVPDLCDLSLSHFGHPLLRVLSVCLHSLSSSVCLHSLSSTIDLYLLMFYAKEKE